MLKLISPSVCLYLILCSLSTSICQAQIKPDRSVNTQVQSSDQLNIEIDGGQAIGQNLFHSFNSFSVPTNGVAQFNNKPEIANIISRVTGSSVSNIDGTLRARGTANLFLINPNGVVFGPNARLDIGGSFLASTAESITFSDEQVFSARDGQQPSLLSINVPIGLQFGVQPGPITVQGSALAVDKGQTLSLAGGGMELTDASLTALGGRVELGGVAEAGELQLNSEIGFEVPENIERADIELSDSDLTVASDGGGDIGIFAKNIKLFAKSKLTAGIAEDEGFVQAQAGDIDLHATKGITIQRSSTVRNLVGVVELADENKQARAVGNGGNINIDTRTLTLRDGGEIRADTSGVGNTGMVTIRARESIFAEGRAARPPDGPSINGKYMQSGVFSNVNPEAQGDTGDVVIETNKLTLSSGSRIESSSFGDGDAGKVKIRAKESIELHGPDSNIFSNVNLSVISEEDQIAVIGNVEGVDIETGKLMLKRGGSIHSSVRGGGPNVSNSEVIGEGGSGLVKIVATDSISISGGDGEPGNNRRSGLFSVVADGVTGSNNPGLQLEANSLTLKYGGQISSATNGRGNAGDIDIKVTDSILLEGRAVKGVSAILSSANTGSKGDAGEITIEAGSLTTRDGSLISTSAFGEGDAGQIDVSIKGRLFSEGEDLLNASPDISPAGGIESRVGVDSTGNAGGLKISAKSLVLKDGAQLSVTTLSSGFAGDINLTVDDSITLSGDRTGVFANTLEGSTGRGGDIFIDPIHLTIQNGAEISVQSEGSGAGGNIEATAGFLTLDQGTISASVTNQQGGDITLNVGNLLLLGNESLISAQALNNAAGGNITINAGNGLVVGTRSNGAGNDIVADAFAGQGGEIFINAQGILGFNVQEALSSSNDVDASSDFGTSGTVAFNTPETEPSDNIIELPELVVLPPKLAQRCRPGQALGNGEFVNVGRGGIPADPTALSTYHAVWHDLRTFDQVAVANDAKLSTEKFAKPSFSYQPKKSLVEAQGWMKTPKGMKLVSAKGVKASLARNSPQLC